MGPSPIQIKTSALQRLCKEEANYKEDLKQETARVTKLQRLVSQDASNEDLQYSLKTAIKIRDETARMVPNVNAKIKTVLVDLKSSIKGSSDNEDADRAIAEAESLLKE